jgi:hypothetical protein
LLAEFNLAVVVDFTSSCCAAPPTKFTALKKQSDAAALATAWLDPHTKQYHPAQSLRSPDPASGLLTSLPNCPFTPFNSFTLPLRQYFSPVS